MTFVASRNVRYTPQKNQTWFFLDDKEEGSDGNPTWIEWKITDETEDDVTIVKETGKDKGYTTKWPKDKLAGEGWRPGSESEAKQVLWNCPDCDQPNNVPAGDYMCVECREGLEG